MELPPETNGVWLCTRDVRFCSRLRRKYTPSRTRALRDFAHPVRWNKWKPSCGKFGAIVIVLDQNIVRERDDRVAHPTDHVSGRSSVHCLATINTNSLPAAQGNYAEAEALYQRSLAVTEKALGQEHHGVVVPLNNLAEVLCSQVITSAVFRSIFSAMFECPVRCRAGHSCRTRLSRP